ncbi:hypothetical protein GCM10023210_31080 [Chryseobacterium ginsengisoli]|uniref:Uncharacterized protein n=1 Tax=Chryseobacterium ginsengisoli TaxID=363853 RepID=A0ABP9MKS9_9FLAO
MLINGHRYREEEVLFALRQEGFKIVPFETYRETHIHGSTFIKDYYTTKCAVKGDQEPTDENVWSIIARKIFEIKKDKPKLIGYGNP